MKQFSSSLLLLLGLLCGLINAASIPAWWETTPPIIPHRHHENRTTVKRAELVERDSGLDARAPTSRLVKISGTMEIKDDDGVDEYCTYGSSIAPFHISTGVPAVRQYWEGRCGGEIRIEVHLNCYLINGASQTIRVDYDARLYEGTSESSNDLDGRRVGSFDVDPNAQKKFFIGLNNDAEGGDWAAITLNVFNGNWI